jgi:hypothetical protein
VSRSLLSEFCCLAITTEMLAPFDARERETLVALLSKLR